MGRAMTTPVPAWAHPIFLVSLALLVLNDRIGKARYPGLVTGKVSDLVGPIVLGTLVGIVVRRYRPDRAVTASIAVPALVMVIIKTSTAGAGLGVWILEALTPWPHRIVADPWDLLGLVGLAAMPTILRESSAPAYERNPSSVGSTPRPARWLVLGVALWACTATSAPQPVDRTRVAVEDGGGLVAFDDEALWTEAIYAPDPNGPWELGPEVDLDTLRTVSASNERCLERSPGVCIRTGPDLRIEESRDGGGSWATVWVLDAAESWVGQTRSDAATLGAERLAAGEVLELADGRAVVAMGVFEPVTRGVDGVWGPEPTVFRDVPGTAWVFLPMMVGGLVFSAALLWPSWSHVRSRILGLIATLIGLPTVLSAGLAWVVSPYDAFVFFPFFIVALGATGIQLIFALIGWGFRLADADRRGQVGLGFAAAGAATVVLLILTFVVLVIWQSGAIGWDPARLLVAAVALVGSVAASAAIGRGMRTSADPVPA